MYCPQCGREYEEKVNFCCHCGAAMFIAPSPHKRLTRSRKNKKIAGVCGGGAEYLDLDPTLVRGAWGIVALFFRGGLVRYLIPWIIMPDEPVAETGIAPTVPQPAR